MSVGSEKLAALRHLLAERFPTPSRVAGRVLPTGLRAIDELAGGLPRGAVTEIVCAAPSCGSHLLLGQLLSVARRTQQRAALIDSADSFDPASYPPDLLAHLLWIRCPKPAVALPVADVMARDANLGLVILDLRRGPEPLLRRTPSTFWYRLQRAVETTDLALVIETPRAAIPSAQLRLQLTGSHELSALDWERPTVLTELAPTLQRQRLSAVAAAG